MADEEIQEHELGTFGAKALAELSSRTLGLTGPLAAVHRSFALQEKLFGPVRALERSGLLAKHEAIAQVTRSLEATAGMRRAVSAVSQLSRMTGQIERSLLPTASIQALAPSFDKGLLAEVSGVARVAALGARLEMPMVSLAMARPVIDEAKWAGISRAIDKTAFFSTGHHKSVVAAIGRSVEPGVVAMLKRHELMGSSIVAQAVGAGRVLDMTRVESHLKHLHRVSNLVRPMAASLALHQISPIIEAFNKTAWLGRAVADAMAIAASEFDLLHDEVLLDDEKARLAETFTRSPAGLILPPGPSTLRDADEASGLLDMVGRSPYHWVRTGAGLLVALTKSYISYNTTRYSDADELVVEVARDNRLHDFVTTHLVPYGDERVEAFRDGSFLYVKGRPFSAIPILINHLEGVLAAAAINAGFLVPDPKMAGKPRFKKNGNPIGGADDAIKGLAATGVLTPEEAEYLVRHVYGTRGNAFRHGQPSSYDEIQAARLILGFYVVTERTRDVA